MTKLILIDARKNGEVTFEIGVQKSQAEGSHASYNHPDGRYTTVPHHKGRVLARPLIREILKEIEISIDKYNKYLEKI